MVNDMLIEKGFFININMFFKTTEWYHYGQHSKNEYYFTYEIHDCINLERTKINRVTDELTPTVTVCNEQFKTYLLAEAHAIKYIQDNEYNI